MSALKEFDWSCSVIHSVGIYSWNFWVCWIYVQSTPETPLLDKGSLVSLYLSPSLSLAFSRSPSLSLTHPRFLTQPRSLLRSGSVCCGAEQGWWRRFSSSLFFFTLLILFRRCRFMKLSCPWLRRVDGNTVWKHRFTSACKGSEILWGENGWCTSVYTEAMTSESSARIPAMT